ncbi:hypothetical protein [Asticcacaulis sp.]|uniref:hypothetical protein n=1 Tax=Asticcacaulis sp. TaxID=1872648 RepID=UPI003F7C3332
MSDPITWAVAAIKAYGAWAAQHAIAAAAIKIVATAVVTKALTPKAKGIGATGTQTSFKADPQAPSPFLIGRTGTAGYNVFTYPSGEKNKYLNFFTVFSRFGPLKAFEAFTANKVTQTFNAGGTLTSGGTFAGKMWLIAALGLTPATALATPTDLTTSGPVAEWTSDHKLSGMAAHRWTLEFDSKVYANGVPQPLSVWQGIRAYDPRLDSTYPGGIGDQRADDPDTWGYDSYDNPYTVALTYLLGYWENGKRVGGVGLAPAMIDIPAFVEGANVADVNGWKVGGEFTSQDTKWSVLTNILQAGGGEPLKIGAKVSCRINAPRTALATFGEADVAGAVHVPGVRSRRERKNSIIPRYRSEAHDWQMVAAEPITAPEYQAEDGGLRQKETEFPLVQQDEQAGQLAGYELVNGRELYPITITAKPAWMGYRPGDCINLNLPEMGLITQKAIILNRDLDLATGTVSMTLTSETDGKHAFALGQTAVPPPTPGLTVPDFTTIIAPAVEAFHASVGYLTSGANALPAISITGVGDNPFAKYIVIEYRVVGAADWIEWATAPATTTAFTITGLDAGQTYEIAISYISVLGVRGARRVYGPFITGAVNANQLGGIDGATIINGLNTNIEGLAKEILSRQNLDAFTKATFYDGDGKSIKTVALNAIDKADNAVSTINFIGAFNADHSAFILNGGTVSVVDADGVTKTLSTYVNAVSTKVGDLETTVAIQQESLDGITGKLTLSVTAPGGTGGIVIGAGEAGSYIGMAAGEFAIFDNSDPSVYTIVFGYASGVITLNSAIKINGAAVINGTLTINAVPVNFVIVPAYAKTAMIYHGDDSTTFTLCETTITLDTDGYLECSANVYQGFPSGDDNWNIWLYVDGVADEPTSYIQGDWTQVQVRLDTIKYKPAGTYTVTLKWKGGSTVENVVGVLFAKGLEKTS